MNPEPAPVRRASAPRVHPATRWHRILGIVSVVIVLFTTATGLLLNHSERFDLAHRHPDSPLVDRLYGQGRAAAASFQTAQGWITQLGTRIYFDGRFLAEHDSRLVGAAATDDVLLVAYDDLLVEYDHNQEVAETYGELDGIKPPIKRLGRAGDQFAIDSADGVRRFDPAASTFAQAGADSQIEWLQPAALPQAIAARLTEAYRGEGVSWERLLLDFHSGRLFGIAGVLVVDLSAISLLILALTGAYMFFRFKRTPPRPSPRKAAPQPPPDNGGI